MSRRLLLAWLMGLAAAPIALGCGGDDAGKKKKDGKDKDKDKDKDKGTTP